MDQLISATTGSTTILLQLPREVWFNEPWIVALISALSGVFIASFFSLFIDYLKTKKLNKIIIKNIYTEVLQNRILNNRDLPVFKEKMSEFRVMAESNNFHSHPSMAYTGKLSMDYYNAYLKELGLFDNFIRTKIFSFYEYLKSIALTAKGLEKRFIKFYDEKDVTIDWHDVVNLAEKHIKEMEMLDKLGAQISAYLICKFKVDSEIKDNKLKKKKKELRVYLKKINVGAIIDIKKIAEQFRIDMISCIITIFRIRKFKDIGTGKYKKII